MASEFLPEFKRNVGESSLCGCFEFKAETAGNPSESHNSFRNDGGMILSLFYKPKPHSCYKTGKPHLGTYHYYRNTIIFPVLQALLNLYFIRNLMGRRGPCPSFSPQVLVRSLTMGVRNLTNLVRNTISK